MVLLDCRSLSSSSERSAENCIEEYAQAGAIDCDILSRMPISRASLRIALSQIVADVDRLVCSHSGQAFDAAVKDVGVGGWFVRSCGRNVAVLALTFGTTDSAVVLTPLHEVILASGVAGVTAR